MNHRVKITVATAAFAVATVVLVTDALSATDAEERRIALVAYDRAVLEKDQARLERMESAAAHTARIRAAQLEFGRMCVIQPVMTDAAMASCKLAYRL